MPLIGVLRREGVLVENRKKAASREPLIVETLVIPKECVSVVRCFRDIVRTDNAANRKYKEEVAAKHEELFEANMRFAVKDQELFKANGR
ncbi:hypothetical protein V6N11_033075, partial [Hibiscus sabdariffa]